MARRQGPGREKLLDLGVTILLTAASHSFGDGGTILKRETLNGLNVTVFASPSPLRAGPVDVSVLVQDGDKPVLDATVELELVGSLRRLGRVGSAVLCHGFKCTKNSRGSQSFWQQVALRRDRADEIIGPLETCREDD